MQVIGILRGEKKAHLDSRSSLLYIGSSKLLAVYLCLMSLYVLICNCSIIDLVSLIVFLTFLVRFVK
jgi:hypothetical protein